VGCDAGSVAQHLSVLTLGVADVARARSFYVDGLGWQVAWEGDGVVFVHLGHGQLLALWGAADLAADTGLELAPGSGSVALAKNVGTADEVDVLVGLAVEAGATVVVRPRAAGFGGYHAYLRDPDGVLWEIAHNPGFSVGPDGRARIEDVRW
jgi:catechol 2,3-dioxygenase-like lactoylglutathione lyase family enzyme